MQSPSVVPVSDASAPSLFEGLQARAHAGMQATADIVKEQIHLARQATSNRINTAKAGKQLLDEGGESAAEVVVAKEASRAASEIDRSVTNRLQVAIVKLDISVAKLRMLQSSQCTGPSPENVIVCNINASQLADEHEARAAICKEIATMLETPISSAEMTPEEFDALAIVKAKVGCKTMMSMTSQGLENMRQKTLASVTSGSTAQRDQNEPTAEPASGAGQATLIQALQEKTWAGMQKVKQAANDRVEIAKAGKRLLDDGGECAAQVVVTKEALNNAADIDRELAQRVQSAISVFDVSVAKLRAVQLRQEAEGINGCGNLAELAEEHELRVKAYRQIASMLEMPVSSIEMDPAECDALSLVKVRDSCSALQCRTNEGFEAAKSIAFSGCAHELDRERREVDREWRRMRTACA